LIIHRFARRATEDESDELESAGAMEACARCMRALPSCRYRRRTASSDAASPICTPPPRQRKVQRMSGMRESDSTGDAHWVGAGYSRRGRGTSRRSAADRRAGSGGGAGTTRTPPTPRTPPAPPAPWPPHPRPSPAPAPRPPLLYRPAPPRPAQPSGTRRLQTTRRRSPIGGRQWRRPCTNAAERTPSTPSQQ